MQVDVDQSANTTHFHMTESGDFEDVETLEDYNVVSVLSAQLCYLHGRQWMAAAVA